MSEVPKGWSRVALEDVADVLDFEREPINSTDRDSRINGKTVSDLYPYYGATGQVGFIDAFRSEGQRVLLGEDAAPFLDPIKDKAYLANGRFWVNNHAHILAGAAGLVDNKFLCHQLNTVDYHPFVTGSTRLKLTSSAMKQIPMVVAPSAEQTRIVTKLEELLSDLDAGVAELKAAQKKLAQYRQSLLKAAVDGSLTAEWRKNNPPIETGAELLERILKERRARWEAKQLAKFQEQGKTPPKDWQKKYPEPIAPVPITEISIPETWQWTGLEQLSDGSPHGLKAGPFGSALKKEFYVPDGYKVYGQEQVIRGDTYYGDYFITKEKYEELISCAIKPGDLLISLVGTTGKILFLPKDARPGIINPRLLKISLSPTNVDPHYIKVVLESPYARHFYKQNAHGGTMDVLNLGILKALAVPIPSVEEQYQIVQQLSEQMDAIATQEKSIEISLKQAAAQRQNILRAAFAGQLVPQDPNDEPASVLLERIRAERASLDSTKKARTSKPRKAAT
ncbi:MAG: restriction endonuclease subunit S [Fluviibacter phosphoraccumulans]